MLGEIAIERNSTIVLPAQFLDSVRDLGAFVSREAGTAPGPTSGPTGVNGSVNGHREEVLRT